MTALIPPVCTRLDTFVAMRLELYTEIDSLTPRYCCSVCFLLLRSAFALQSFLDKGDATARILAVVKAFEKVRTTISTAEV